MIEVNNISFSYSKNKEKYQVIDKLNVKFEEGKFYTIFGPSGCGKSTLLSLLGGLETPDNGTIFIDSNDIHSVGVNNIRKDYISYVFQNYLLFPYLTAIENVTIAMDICNSGNKDKNQVAIDLLKSLNLQENDIHKKVSRLSGGQQQRVAIARTMALNTPYILADEPTGNLDKKTALEIIHIFRTLVDEHKKCLIVVSHSEMVKQFSDISYELIDGQLIEYGDKP